MSQIFDSLRRSRKSDVRSIPSRTAHGDAVLTTLGYAPPARGTHYLPVVVITALIFGTAAIAWLASRAYFDVADPAKPSPPLSRSASSPALPAAPQAEAVDSSAAAEPIAQTVGRVAEVSSIGRRPSRAARTDPDLRMPDPGPRTTDPGESLSPSAENDLTLALYYHRSGDYAKALQHYRALLDRNELNAQAHNNLGLLYQQANLLQESARELQRAVVLEPRNPGTRNNYGVTLLMLGRLDHAAAEFQTALWLEPQNVDALINLSLVQRQAGQLDAAKETLLRVLNVVPQNAPAHYNLAQLYEDTNERARAVEHYRLFLDNAGAEHADRATLVRARIAALNTMSK